MTTRQQWLLSMVAAAVVVGLLIVDFNQTGQLLSNMDESQDAAYLLFFGFAFLAIATARRLPEVALAAGWGAGLVQVLGGIPLSLVELPLVAVLFCAARWGRVGTAVIAGFTIPVAPLLVYLSQGRSLYNSQIGIELVLHRGVAWLAMFGLAVLGLPWLLGLTLRFVARASRAQQAQHTAEEEAVQAHEIARLREEQNRLARDVHDVVGHSLAVILAQAESAQFLDDDTAKLKLTMENIATSARTSLQDVRQVLAPNPAGRTPMRLDQLLAGVLESGGGKVEVEHVGVARPLPPELEEVGYRVLQEMLTNALKHGNREAPVRVELAWPQEGGLEDSLRIEVRNDIGPEPTVPAGSGQGVEGMRRRLASVRGHLDVRRRELADGPTFTATAALPIRDAGGLHDRR